jgi:hypothetical protein
VEEGALGTVVDDGDLSPRGSSVADSDLATLLINQSLDERYSYTDERARRKMKYRHVFKLFVLYFLTP